MPESNHLQFAMFREFVTCVCFNNDGTEIISGAIDGDIKIWNSATGASKDILRGHNQAVRSISYQYGPRGHEGILELFSC